MRIPASERSALSTATLPRGVRRALDAMRDDPARIFSMTGLAAIAGLSVRTLQRQFRDFVGKTPRAVLAELRLELARRSLLGAPGDATVSAIAAHCGFRHLGRFASAYRRRYGESPSSTLERRRNETAGAPALHDAPLQGERPTIAVTAFAFEGEEAFVDFAAELVRVLSRQKWLRIAPADRARYRLGGNVRRLEGRDARMIVTLEDAASGSYLWADRWEGAPRDLVNLAERTASRIAGAIVAAVRDAELTRFRAEDAAAGSAWDLTMRALPCVISGDAAEQARALEFLEQAMEIAPGDPLPMSLAAWCHGLRGSVYLSPKRKDEKERALLLARKADDLNIANASTEALLASGYVLAGDLSRAAAHIERALAIDGGNSWAWGRGGLIRAYRGEPEEAIDWLKIALSLAPVDVMNAFFCAGIGTAHFHRGRFRQAIHWFTRASAESPKAVWINHLLASACALGGHPEEARRSLRKWTAAYPDATIADIRGSMPFPPPILDRIADGLERIGMRG